MENLNSKQIIALLGMKPHPEGGRFVETFRDNNSTAIYFLLEAGERSHWHRVHNSSEIWHYYAGGPLMLSLSANGEDVQTRRLGTDLGNGDVPQIAVAANCWQMAESLGPWTLVGCTVAPGFDFANFEMAPPDWYPGKEISGPQNR